MVNHFILVGRVTEIKPINNSTIITLAIARSYKNNNGFYETDLIKITTNGTIAKKINEYLENGDLVGIRGVIESNNILIAEKISFLSTKKEEVN